MVHSVACCAVDDWRVGDILTVMNHDGPDVDEREESYGGELLLGKDEWEKVVGYGLSETVEWMEGVRCVRRGHDPLVVSFMQRFVYARVVQASVDEVDETIGEEDEEWKLEVVVEVEWCLRGCVVEFCVAPDLSCESDRSQD